MNKSLGIYNLIDSNGINKSIGNVMNGCVDFNTYTTPKGMKELRKEVSNFLFKTQRIKVDASNIMITTGSQQSLNLIAKTFLKNKSVVVEQPTYFGTLNIFEMENVKMIGVEIENNGIDIEKLKSLIQKHSPKYVYVTPTFNNPTGYSWTNKNRKEFLNVVNDNNIIVIEDDPYSLINYTKTKYKSLYNLNKGKNVIYLGTFSKLISPSINVGYIVADDETINKLYPTKKNYDLNTNTFLQCVVLDYLRNNNVLEIVNNKINTYKSLIKKSKIFLKSKYKNKIEKMTNIKGGLFYLVKFKDKINTNKFENANMFYMDKTDKNLARINICSFLNE